MLNGNCFEIKYTKKFPFVIISRKNLFAIFFIAMLVGIVAFFYETLLDYVIMGYLFDRGFLIGPFIPIYFFCIFIGLCYIKTPKFSLKNILLSIIAIGCGISLIEFIVGNVFELLVGQELWTYDGFMPLSYKYVSLTVALVWGLLGTFIVMFIFPLLKKISDKIPDKVHLPIVITFLVLFITDIIFSFALVIKNGGEYKELYCFKRSIELTLFLIGIALFIIVAIGFAIFLYKSLYKFKKAAVILFFFSLIFMIISCIDYLHKSPSKFISFLSTIGFIIAAFYIYFILALVVITFIRITSFLITRKTILKDTRGKSIALLLSLVISICITNYGMYCLENYKITNLSCGNGDNTLSIVAVSDVHYGSTGTNVDLEKLTQRINKENPDIVFLLGDIFDNTISQIDMDYLRVNLNNIDAKYGVYAISGNHEYEYNSYLDVKDFYATTNVKLLLDESIIINNKVQIVGRLDAIYRNRKKLDDIINKTYSLPIIVLDHQPQDYQDSIDAKATLQLSGHTHNGQLWPGNYLVDLYYKYYFKSNKTHGLYIIDNFTLYVSLGYGAWGFPLRTTGRSEMLKITFKC